MVGMSAIDRHGNIHRPIGAVGGGQFAGRVPTPPRSSLTDASESTGDVRELLARRALLAEKGYLLASSGPSVAGSVRATTSIDSWWDEHFRRAEIGPTDTFHQMPDDYTPSRGSGRSLSGHRRVHRILYEGAGIAIRMPSATTIRRYSQEIGQQTFDVPVQAEGESGQVIAGYVRVTQEGPDRWSVSALGMPSQASWKISEAVSSVLESRRPSRALREIGDLAAKRRERLAGAGTTLDGTESTWVHGVGYNEVSQEMVIKLGDRVYGYKVGKAVYQQVRNAFSPGSAYNRLVKGKPRVSIEECGSCGRWYNTTTGHTCLRHKARTGIVKPFNDTVAAYVRGAGEGALTTAHV